jgi:hypothetical protein
MSKAPEVIQAAEDYARRGWSVLPLKVDKKPAVTGWKSYQTIATKPEHVEGWFAKNPKAVGVGVILGRVSGGMYVRDFDKAESYSLWAAAYPTLATTLPTVKTSRGYHVYARWADLKTSKCRDGELRGEGSYVVAPPSEHASGAVYTWLVGLPDDELPELDPEPAGLAQDWGEPSKLLACVTERTESTETQRHRDAETPRHGDDRDTEDTEDAEDAEAIIGAILQKERAAIESAISRTQPGDTAKRNSHLFKLARALKAIPGLRDVPPHYVRWLKPVVKEWHRRALPTIVTKDWGSTWGDFLNGWRGVKYAEGEDVLGKAMAAAKAADPPAFTAGYAPEHRLLASLCRELQRIAGSEPFFLSNAKAGEAVGVDKRQANRWLGALIGDLALRIVKKHTRHQATRYRWTEVPPNG